MSQNFAAKRVYPSEQGLHIEHYTETEAQAAYVDAKSKGMNVELNGLVMTWKFHNPKVNPHLVASPTRQGRLRQRISRCKLQQLQLRRLLGAALDKRQSHARKAARPPRAQS